MHYLIRNIRLLGITLIIASLLAVSIGFTADQIKSSLANRSKESNNPISLIEYKGEDGEQVGESKYGWLEGQGKREDLDSGKREEIPLKDKVENSFNLNIKDKSTWPIFIFVLLLISLFFIVIRKFKKKKRKSVSTISVEKKAESRNNSIPLQKAKQEKNQVLPIRNLLIEWEQQLPSYQQRQAHETIQQWFGRIQKSNDFVPIYEKVRYGKQSITNEEMERCREFLFRK